MFVYSYRQINIWMPVCSHTSYKQTLVHSFTYKHTHGALFSYTCKMPADPDFHIRLAGRVGQLSRPVRTALISLDWYQLWPHPQRQSPPYAYRIYADHEKRAPSLKHLSKFQRVRWLRRFLFVFNISNSNNSKEFAETHGKNSASLHKSKYGHRMRLKVILTG